MPPCKGVSEYRYCHLQVMKCSRPHSHAERSTSSPTRCAGSPLRCWSTSCAGWPTSPAGRSAADTRVCNTQAIHVVDPQTLKIQKNITVDQTGAPLTNAQNKSRTWNDVAFVEVPAHSLSLCSPALSWVVLNICCRSRFQILQHPCKTWIFADPDILYREAYGIQSVGHDDYLLQGTVERQFAEH